METHEYGRLVRDGLLQLVPPRRELTRVTFGSDDWELLISERADTDPGALVGDADALVPRQPRQEAVLRRPPTRC